MRKYQKFGSLIGLTLLYGGVTAVPFVSTSCGNKGKDEGLKIDVSSTYYNPSPYDNQPTNYHLLSFVKLSNNIMNESKLTENDFDWTGTPGSNVTMTVKSSVKNYKGAIKVNYSVKVDISGYYCDSNSYANQPNNTDFLSFAKTKNTVLQNSMLNENDFDWTGTPGSNVTMTVKSSVTNYKGAITLYYFLSSKSKTYSNLTSSDNLRMVFFTGTDTNTTYSSTIYDNTTTTGLSVYTDHLRVIIYNQICAELFSSPSVWMDDFHDNNITWDKSSFGLMFNVGTGRLIGFTLDSSLPSDCPFSTATFVLI